jgi:hypothetical protein
MKTKHTNQINLFDGGKDKWEQTEEYRNRSNKIVKEVTVKYSTSLTNEKNWLKRLLIKIKLKREIRTLINELSSLKNLHVNKILFQ